MRGRTSRIVAVVIGVLVLLGLSTPSYADSGDRITDYAIAYTINADGTVSVVEDISYAFAGSDRHGIYRTLLTRQPFGDGSERDVVYRIDDIEVTSPDAPAQFTTSTKSDGFRLKWLELKIGDAKKTLSTKAAHYRIGYRLTGALRTVNGIPELYWNATGADWDATIERVRITVTAPAGATAVSCYQGRSGSTDQCAGRIDDGSAALEATGLAAGEGVTVSVQVPAGSVRGAEPIVEPAGSLAQEARLGPVTVGGAALAFVLSLLGAVGMRRANRDQRYASVAPGIVDPAAPVERDRVPKDTIPVRFDPPQVPPAHGAVLLSLTGVSKAAASTLTDLAHRGVLAIEAVPKEGAAFRKSGGLQRTAVLRNLSAAPPGYAASFARAIFDGTDRMVIDKPGSADRKRFQKAVAALSKEVSKEPARSNWRTRGSMGMLIALAIGLVLVTGALIAASVVLQRGVVVYLPALIGAIIALVAGIVLWGIGYRTAQGRALTDQVVGFRRYLETAEAGSLRFEEGQDIFSAYLPWAIVFGVADRWQRVCAELAAQGRIPDSPNWYVGPAFYSSFDSGSSFGDSLSSSVTSSSGSAGGSGAGGGGMAGGGGGGGGGGSW